MAATKPLWLRAEEILENLLDVDPSEYDERVAEACGDEDRLAFAVHALLAGLTEADDGSNTEFDPLETMAEEVDRASESLAIGDRVDGFEILGRLGQGGMASVYRARRLTAEFHQEVALKVLSDQLNSKEANQRFVFERQIAASLDHSNIAKLIDGGVTEDGRPYFALELVEGAPIDEYCDELRLSVEGRVRLMVSVARAVHYAHQNLLVHRDLKPSNILVEEGDRVRLLDFGIAKPLDPNLPRLARTQTGALLLTPLYASPEQFSGGAITTASDQYQLGLILFELVTGHRHHLLDGEDLGSMSRRIHELETPRPSGLVSRETTGTATGSVTGDRTMAEIAAARCASPRDLSRRVRGDLDTIILKSLEKDPSRRYRSVEAFAADLERFLADEPVHARPTSFGYRMMKFSRRHRLAVAAAGIGLVALVSGASLASWQAVRATRAERSARAEAATATQVSEFLVDLFEVSDPEVARGDEMTARELLDRGRLKIEAELEEQPLIQARMMEKIAEIHRKLGMYEEALPLASEALETRSSILGEEHREVARSLHALGRLYADSGDDAAAEPLLVRAEELFIAQVGETSIDRLEAAIDLARLAYRRSDLDDAEARFRLVLEALEARPEWTETVAYAEVIEGLGILHFARAELREAEALQRRAIELREAQGDDDHPALAEALSDLANTLGWEGRDREAAELHERAVAVLEKTYGPDHRAVSEGLNRLGQLYGRTGRLEEAEAVFVRSNEIKEKVFGPGHPQTVAGTLNVGRVRLLLGDFAGAERLLREAISTAEEGLGQEHPLYGFAHSELGDFVRGQGRLQEAGEHYEIALSVLEAAFGPEHARLAETLSGMANVRLKQDRFSEAQSLFDRALSIQQAAFDGDQPPLAGTLNGLGELSRRRGDLAAAREFHQRAHDAWASAYDEDHPAAGRALALQGLVELDAEDLAAAETAFRRALEISDATHGVGAVESVEPLEGLAVVAERRGRREESREFLRRSEEIRREKFGGEKPASRP